MEQMVFSEAEAGCRYIAYIAGALANARGVCAEICAADGRVYLRARGEGLAAAQKSACERAAEVLGIGYKYAALSRLVRPAGLGREEREILLAAMIAADFPPERRYILARLQTGGECAVDGVYRFRLQTLRKKWESVAACVPAVFTCGRLEEFMRYLLGGSRGKVFVKEDGVYDSRCRKLRRACLIGSDPRLDTLREIVLSGAGKVECLAPPCAAEENFLRRYYAGRVGFSS